MTSWRRSAAVGAPLRFVRRRAGGTRRGIEGRWAARRGCAHFSLHVRGLRAHPPGGTGVGRLSRTIRHVAARAPAAASSRRRTCRASRHCADSAFPRCPGRAAPARRGGDRRRCAARRRGKAPARCVRARPSAGVSAVRGRASRGGGPLGGGVRAFPCMSGVCAHTPWRRRQPTTRDTPSVTTLCRESFASRSPTGGVRTFPCMSGICAHTPGGTGVSRLARTIRDVQPTPRRPPARDGGHAKRHDTARLRFPSVPWPRSAGEARRRAPARRGGERRRGKAESAGEGKAESAGEARRSAPATQRPRGEAKTARPRRAARGSRPTQPPRLRAIPVPPAARSATPRRCGGPGARRTRPGRGRRRARPAGARPPARR
ncbi:MAG: hypothetical protein QOG70_1323 [Solirubrobacteraceae bacterium]|nr:hypothetical protein [Solirubrobacteraceae bacterium]